MFQNIDVCLVFLLGQITFFSFSTEERYRKWFQGEKKKQLRNMSGSNGKLEWNSCMRIFSKEREGTSMHTLLAWNPFSGIASWHFRIFYRKDRSLHFLDYLPFNLSSHIYVIEREVIMLSTWQFEFIVWQPVSGSFPLSVITLFFIIGNLIK